MAEMAGVHMRMSEDQLRHIKKKAEKLGVNQSEIVRKLIDKDIRKNGHKIK